MRPIIDKNETYEKFLLANSWVDVDDTQREQNNLYIFSDSSKIASIF